VHSPNLVIAHRVLGELFSRGRSDVARELVAPECAVRDPLLGACVGAESLAARIREMRGAFPGLTWTVDDVLADEGTQLALTWSATAASVKVTGLLLLRIENGKLVAITSRWEPLELMSQLPPRPARVARGSTPAISVTALESELDAQWDLSDA
jgi:hypothetical protein